MAPYATRDQLKLWLGVDLTDNSMDALLDIALNGATEWINDTTGRVFTLDSAASARIFRPADRLLTTDHGMVKVLVDDIGSTTGLVVETGTTTGNWSAVTDYELDPEDAVTSGRPVTGLLRGWWPCGGTDRLRVTARWGWPAVPQRVVEACLIQGARLYRRKDSPEGILGSAEWGMVRVGRVDPDAKAMIDPLTLPGFA